MPFTVWVHSRGRGCFEVGVPGDSIAARSLRTLLVRSVEREELGFTASGWGVFMAAADGTKQGSVLGDMDLIAPDGAGDANVWVEPTVPAAPAAKRPRTSSPSDTSEEYVATLLADTPRALVTAADLQAALEAPLPRGLLADAATAPHATETRGIFDCTEGDRESTTMELSIALTFPWRNWLPAASEECVATNADNLTGVLWRLIKRLNHSFVIDDARNTHDPSGAPGGGVRRLRPDYCLWHGSAALLLKAEHKRGESELQLAIDELAAKMSGGWNAFALRGLPLLPCYVAAGSRVQFIALLPPTLDGGAALATPASPPFDTSGVRGRAGVQRCALNMARVLALLGKHLSRAPIVPLYKEMRRAGGRTIVTIMDTCVVVVKVCTPAPAAVYDLLRPPAAGAGAPGAATPIPCAITVVERRALEGGRVELKLQPVCVEVLPSNEAELRTAMRSVLAALRAFHAAGFVHRDVRWPNILRDAHGCWRLIDFELAAPDGEALMGDAIHVDFVPPEVLRGEVYKAAGDMYRVGRLLPEWADQQRAELSPGARQFFQSLCASAPGERPSAAAALGCEWLTLQ